MNALAVPSMRSVPEMSDDAIARVRRAEARAADRPKVKIATHHVLHAGLYARTILVPAGTILTGALVEIATTLIVSGDCTVAMGDGRTERLAGYHVLAASGRRKQVFAAHADTWLTMVFATSAKSVAAAEEEFTAEAHRLLSRQPGHANTILVTGR